MYQLRKPAVVTLFKKKGRPLKPGFSSLHLTHFLLFFPLTLFTSLLPSHAFLLFYALLGFFLPSALSCFFHLLCSLMLFSSPLPSQVLFLSTDLSRFFPSLLLSHVFSSPLLSHAFFFSFAISRLFLLFCPLTSFSSPLPSLSPSASLFHHFIKSHEFTVCQILKHMFF
ncbi:unnamed protein product [Acanthosepion pharaonis]|uniref:Transmembrane protein n=1 Tax=Acanthosepion pharaonis TaxID=158019 RepID=A0A812AYV2_ACAPH|nr:unnamed protein product [Sepia pharaonis]